MIPFLTPPTKLSIFLVAAAESLLDIPEIASVDRLVADHDMNFCAVCKTDTCKYDTVGIHFCSKPLLENINEESRNGNFHKFIVQSG